MKRKYLKREYAKCEPLHQSTNLPITNLQQNLRVLNVFVVKLLDNFLSILSFTVSPLRPFTLSPILQLILIQLLFL